MNLAQAIINKYYKKSPIALTYLTTHSKMVATKAKQIAENCQDLIIDFDKLFLSAMLHDIGIIFVNAPDIGCFGDFPYIAHGYKGRELLEKEGLFDIAPVCERHIGVGITLSEIQKQNLPLPFREMIPITLEEKLVCLADKFYSKSEKYLLNEKPIEIIRADLLKHGSDKLEKLNELMVLFGIAG